MSEVAIRVEGLSKAYRITPGQERKPYRTLQEDLLAVPRRLLGRGAGGGPKETLWALDDLSFDVREGEVLGVIGRNGAGKSTLLKVLSRITEPTKGQAEIYGRVGSLLEVGTGFHPELTGRENVYLSGAILGMRREEITRRFDEIVEFAGVQAFTETPVKRYSSGMYMRLAFAVAAHLDTEILIVDEVLAVGDADFQKKCLNKMESAGQEGRTVLFVSHNMAAVTRLCDRTILLDQGRLQLDGPSYKVVQAYLKPGGGAGAEREWMDPRTAPGNGVVRLRAIRVRNEANAVTDQVDIRLPVTLEMVYDVLEPGHVLVPNLHIYNGEGTCAFVTNDLDPAWHRRARPRGRFVSAVRIPGNFLSEGQTTVRAAISTYIPFEIHVDVPDAVTFQVADSLQGGTARGDYAGPMPGAVRPILPWRSEVIPLVHADQQSEGGTA